MVETRRREAGFPRVVWAAPFGLLFDESELAAGEVVAAAAPEAAEVAAPARVPEEEAEEEDDEEEEEVLPPFAHLCGRGVVGRRYTRCQPDCTGRGVVAGG